MSAKNIQTQSQKELKEVMKKCRELWDVEAHIEEIRREYWSEVAELIQECYDRAKKEYPTKLD